MPGYSLRPPLFRIIFLALSVMAPRLVAAQAAGPQSVRVPAPIAKAGAAKSKTDRGSLPPIPTFKDIAKDVGLTAVHISAPEAHYVIDSTSGGAGLFDCDDDGKLDLFVTGFGGSALYHGLGNCKFEDVTEKAGVGGSGFMTGAAWGDYDRDGFVDLFVSRYSHLDMNNLPQFGSNKFCRFKGILVQCGPWGLEGESDFLYHN